MPDVTLRITLGNFSVEVTGPKTYAEKKLEELASKYFLSGRTAASEPRSGPISLEKAGKKLAPAEFMKKATPKNQTDRAAALAYYLEKVEGQAGFTTGELGELGKKAKYPFGNISDVVARLVSRGLMMSSGEKEGQRAYALTASGEEYVESMLEPKL